MINYIIIFFVLAIIASVLGFGVLGGTFAYIAQVIAIIFLVIFLMGIVKHFMRNNKP